MLRRRRDPASKTSLSRVAIDASAASTPSTQAKWSSAEFRRLLRQLALQFNGDRARAFPGGGASALEPGVFYGFEDAVRARRRWPSNFASARGHDIPHNCVISTHRRKPTPRHLESNAALTMMETMVGTRTAPL